MRIERNHRRHVVAASGPSVVESTSPCVIEQTGTDSPTNDCQYTSERTCGDVPRVLASGAPQLDAPGGWCNGLVELPEHAALTAQ